MKIKNFNLNQKAISKLATYVLAGTLIATTLTGCQKNIEENCLLQGTILENTCVVTLEDGSKDFAIAVSSCDHEEYHHYYSVISGIYFGGNDCWTYVINGNTVHHYGITNEENITNYLTTDELTKALEGTLNNEDIIAIVGRVIEPTKEETNTKTK